MEFRRLVLDLIHCSVLSWLYLRRYGLELSADSENVTRTDTKSSPPGARDARSFQCRTQPRA